MACLHVIMQRGGSSGYLFVGVESGVKEEEVETLDQSERRSERGQSDAFKKAEAGENFLLVPQVKLKSLIM